MSSSSHSHDDADDDRGRGMRKRHALLALRACQLRRRAIWRPMRSREILCTRAFLHGWRRSPVGCATGWRCGGCPEEVSAGVRHADGISSAQRLGGRRERCVLGEWSSGGRMHSRSCNFSTLQYRDSRCSTRTFKGRSSCLAFQNNQRQQKISACAECISNREQIPAHKSYGRTWDASTRPNWLRRVRGIVILSVSSLPGAVAMHPSLHPGLQTRCRNL